MSKQTAMQALVDLLKVKDAYKQCMPYIIEIIDEVYLPMEREQIENAWDRGQYIGMSFPQGFIDNNFEQDSEAYYNETYKGGEQ